MEDIPQLGLHRGDVGLVCSTWFSSTPACYEIEFRPEKSTSGIRALLMSKQLGEVQKTLEKQIAQRRPSKQSEERPPGPCGALTGTENGPLSEGKRR